jgi:hypothetical protein
VRIARIALAASLLLFSSTAAAQAGAGLGSPRGDEPRERAPEPPEPPEPPAAPERTPPAEAPGEPSGETPAEAPAETPAEAPAETPAETPGPTAPPAEADADVPPELADDEALEEVEPPPPPGAPGAEAAPEGERMRMLVVDAATFGIDPVVGRVASARMRATGEEMGYQVLSPEQTVAAAQQLRMPYPPTPADLWRVSWVARAHRGAFARIWAHAGQYVIEITVASLDGAGPFFARGTAGADDLREVVDRLTREAVPPPNVWTEGQAAAGRPGAAGTTGPRPGEAVVEPEPAPEERERRPEEPPAELRRWSLTLQTEGAIGASQDVFYNHLVGVRLDFRVTRSILLGAYVAYANLNGRDGRADNLLVMLQFENRIRIASDLDLTIPLRGAIGYLPFNGPVIRLAAGVSYAISPEWEIGADILVPTFWILPDRTAVSLNLGLEATYRF